LQKDRWVFYPVEKILKDVQRRVLHLQRKSEMLYYLTIVSAGFPLFGGLAGAELGNDDKDELRIEPKKGEGK